MKEFKIGLLGPEGVGKPALVNQFIYGHYHENYDDINEDVFRKEVEVDNCRCVLEIVDTAGMDQFPSMRDLYIKNGHGFVLVYSLTNQRTFQEIKNFRDQVLRVKETEKAPFVLVGNNLDKESHREVPTVEGNALARSWNCPFIEASAKNGPNVNEVFAEIVRQINKKPKNKANENAAFESDNEL